MEENLFSQRTRITIVLRYTQYEFIHLQYKAELYYILVQQQQNPKSYQPYEQDPDTENKKKFNVKFRQSTKEKKGK